MATMSQQLAKKDSNFSEYAGATWDIAKQMAMIDVCKEERVFPESVTPYLMFYRSYLDKLRKAWFASEGSNEITKLGLLLGWTQISVRATKPDIH
jgi:hypothetical protein